MGDYMRTGFLIGGFAFCAVSSVMMANTCTIIAQDSQAYNFDIPSQDLDTALRTFARTTRQQVLFRGKDVRGKRNGALTGNHTAPDALSRLLEGTGLSFRIGAQGVFLVSGPDRAARSDESGAEDVLLTITGSRIRGAPPTAPVTVVTNEDMKRAGQNDLGEVMRSLPQNFSGGQNPGVQTGGEGFGNQNVNSASQANIRGIGADATLTLLNGRRLPYNSVGQGVDISAIPTVAVERVEVLADGASALYGSDAVGGVVNLILKKSYDGLQTSARLAGATEGGNFQQQYNTVAGKSWGSGGILLAGDYSHSSQVTAGQRELTSELWHEQSLFPRLKSYGAVLSAHQDMGANVSFSLDATYNKRTSFMNAPLSATASYLSFGALYFGGSRAIFLSPSLDFNFSNGWRAQLYATYGNDVSYRNSDIYLRNSLFSSIIYKAKNQNYTAEGNAEGPLFSLPAGDVRLAIGGGYRGNKYDFMGAPKYDASNNVAFGFAELFVPIFAPQEANPWLNRLSLTIAVRDEQYDRGVGNVLTPKVGLLYAPSDDLDFKASWGKSFKAPVLSNQYSPAYTYVGRASSFGAVGYPPTASVVYLTGGNENLHPERATTSSLTLSLHPKAWSPFSFDVTYYRTDFRDRVQAVIPTAAAYMGDPAYDFLRTFNPSGAQIDNAIAQSTSGSLINNLGVAFDPANVVAIIDNRIRNVATQYIRGIDATASYQLNISDDRITGIMSVGYVDIKQRLFDGAKITPFSGMVFRIPSWKARGGATWEHGKIVASAFINFTDGVDDRRFTPVTRVSGMTTFDFTLGYTFEGSGLLNKLRLQASAMNLFNAMPARIRTDCPICAPWDSANYSVLGRVMGFSISKDW